MADKDVPKKRVVIDASVARAAGGADGTHPVGQRCRQFLMRTKSVCHRIAMDEMLLDEWKKHQSTFASTWLVEMQSMKKLVKVPTPSESSIAAAITAVQIRDGVKQVMLKDAHLLECSLATDRIVASLDDTVRGHFGRLSRSTSELSTVVWVNPAEEADGLAEWLGAGAPAEKARLLTP